ncbi:hypothetical protein KS4_07870 [Poriferisphaera corsica]|uniref:Uncharacterized protein n=1 Tax=Poriferisphaera corsica TaxID=2528020 RepID=A0A517YR99_9BACT|nr:hypothetical protein [Poriferisphaera corsica]QDU32753.1 hypothetical protein KS4_07870 [Poriferisphaera corsica]
MNSSESKYEPLPADQITWAALLGQWVEFARSAVALPSNDEGARMKDSIADVIMLQAVWFALESLSGLSTDEQALGLNRAALLIKKHKANLVSRYTEIQMPHSMSQLISDAESSYSKAKSADKE